MIHRDLSLGNTHNKEAVSREDMFLCCKVVDKSRYHLDGTAWWRFIMV